MFRTSSSFDKSLDKATSHLLLEPDLVSTLVVCDLIRQGDVQPTYALNALKKKMTDSNPNVALFALQVLESCVKNCGSLIHDVLATKEFMEELHLLISQTTNEKVKNRLLELTQIWAHAFRSQTKYRAVQDMVNIMKTEGYQFPVLKESDAMFVADIAPKWEEGECCHRCRMQFSLLKRKHHCRACGQVFCDACSCHTTTLPKFGIEKEVRVCDPCFEKHGKEFAVELQPESKQSPETATKQLKEKDLQLQEEEEFQLALALSKSEAEEKVKEKLRKTQTILSGKKKMQACVDVKPKISQKTEDEHAEMDSELEHYLNRSFWESKQLSLIEKDGYKKPSAPSEVLGSNYIQSFPSSNKMSEKAQNGETSSMEQFMSTLHSQLEIFVNRIRSDSSRGRNIASDSAVQTLFLNITAMHSTLMQYIQQQDNDRIYYERLQDKLNQIRDARAALDALREEHHHRLQQEAEEAFRIRQLQMAQKLEIMRKKKQEYLEYQSQLALLRMKEQEHEMQLRQEQSKQQYMIGNNLPYPLPNQAVYTDVNNATLSATLPTNVGGCGFPQAYMQPMALNPVYLVSPHPYNFQESRVTVPNNMPSSFPKEAVGIQPQSSSTKNVLTSVSVPVPEDSQSTAELISFD